MTKEEDEEVIKRINGLQPDFVWVGLGAPKQERWMYEHKNKITGVMLGVGAGFDFHATSCISHVQVINEHLNGLFDFIVGSSSCKRCYKHIP